MNNLSRFQSGQASHRLPTNVRCRSCEQDVRDTFVDLGMSPLVQSFIGPEKLDEMEPFYPLHVLICSHCKLAQLRDYVSPDGIFVEYAYFSSYSASWVEHARLYCEMITKRLSLTSDSLVVEIAANDGYLLQHFLPLGIPVLAIEPAANVAEVAKAKGIPAITEFFGTDVASRLAQEGRLADLIIGNNVFAHVPSLNDFISGLSQLLKPEGVITLEFPHLERLLIETQFDTIYHEHYSYFSLLTTERAVAPHGLRVFDVEELGTHGGSLRVFICHENSSTHPKMANVDIVTNREKAAGLDDLTTYTKFNAEVLRVKRDLLQCLISIKNEGKSVVAYGAAGKGNTLLNYCGIGPDFLDFVVDRNPYKHGLFTPGTHVPILPVEALDEAKPDYILILPWNLKAEIISQMAHVGDWGGKFIIPIPYCEIIAPETATQITNQQSVP
jgi:SAM-dependent methyltransferase